MSHQPERKEKNCLNCGTTVVGHYCHVCGQENIETKESFWSLARHFVFDIFHFDGNFFHTLKYIFARPGLVAREYSLGKRASFLHPIRMYLFTSAIFFLIFSYTNHLDSGTVNTANGKMTVKERLDMAETYQLRLKKHPDDTTTQKIITLLTDTTKQVSNQQILALDPEPAFSIFTNPYVSVREYDSVQNTLPADKRDGWLGRTMMRKSIYFNNKYKDRPEEASEIFWESILHKLPIMLFLSLPFFALILKLLYQRRKNFYYSDHAVFTLYHYILSFILLLAVFGVSGLQDQLGWRLLYYVETLLLIAWPLYLLLEMKNFYRQAWGKTIAKFFLLNFLGLLVMFLLFVMFLLLSIFQL